MAYTIESQESLLRLATFYCSKRETSRERLGKYLQRKCIEQKIDQSIYKQWIVDVLDACEKSKFVDDKRYAEMLIHDYTNRGKGRKYVEQKLKEKGISKEFQTVPDDQEQELNRAVALARKSLESIQSKVSRKMERNSGNRRMNEAFELKQKLMQKLVTAGFSIDICKKAILQISI